MFDPDNWHSKISIFESSVDQMIAATTFGSYMVITDESNVFINAMWTIFMYTTSPLTLKQLDAFKPVLQSHRQRTLMEDFFGMWTMGA